MSRIITDLAVFDITPKGLLLVEKVEDVSLDELRAKTEADFDVSPDLKTYEV